MGSWELDLFPPLGGDGGSPTLDARRVTLLVTGRLDVSAREGRSCASGRSSGSESKLKATRLLRDLLRPRFLGGSSIGVVGEDGMGDELAGGLVADE